MSETQVAVKPVEPARGLSIRATVPSGPGVAEVMGDAIGGVLGGGLRLTGAPVAIYHDLEGSGDAIDFEVFCPVESSDVPTATPAGRTLRPRVLEGGERACTVFVGRYEDLATPYRELAEWIDSNGYRVTGSVEEIYMSGPDETGLPVTEIRMPVVRVS